MTRWKENKSYPGYKISTAGEVFSKKRNRLLTISDHGNGYKKVTLSKDGKSEYPFLHRLVYETFVGPIPHGMQINHKDENKNNNCLSNLELLTQNENMAYGTRNERISKSKRAQRKECGRQVSQYNLDGTLVRVWETLADAQESGFRSSGICDCCSGRKKTHKGYLWSYN